MSSLLSDVMALQQVFEMPCAGYGRCGKCRVTVHGAPSALSESERTHLTEKEITLGVRLACCVRVEGDCTVMFEKDVDSQIRLFGEMPDFVLDPLYSVYGVAVDIGTTTLAAYLYGQNGNVLAQAAAPNPQAIYGADVISRIDITLRGEAQALAACIRGGVSELIFEVANNESISPAQIDALVITGNTAMLYLLTQTPPDALSRAPFQAGRLFGEMLSAKTLCLPCPGAKLYLPRCISPFVGADITTALLGKRYP